VVLRLQRPLPVRIAAAIPAAGLILGTAAGLIAPAVPIHLAALVLCVSIAVAIWLCRPASSLLLGLVVGAGFAAGGAALSADAWHRAWRPTLKLAFERLALQDREAAHREGRRVPEDDEASAVVEGVLRTDASVSPAGVSLSVEVDRIAGGPVPPPLAPLTRADGMAAAVGGVLVTVAGALAAERIGEWRAGRRVRMSAQLRRPARYLNAEVADPERSLARRGTVLVGSVKSGALVEVVAHGSLLDELGSAARAYSRRALADAVAIWSPRSAAIVAAIVIGDRAGLDDDVQRRLQEAGTYHVIAISGGNIAIVAGLLLGGFRIAGVLGRAAMASAILALLGYARFVGGGASVNRATLMAVIYFGARILDQRSPPLNALAMVVIGLLATEPLSVVDPAFVLTCGATLALLVGPPKSLVASRLEAARNASGGGVGRRLAGPLGTLFWASCAVELFLLPVGALLFSRVTFAGLALNFLAIPLMAVAQLVGMVLIPVHAFTMRGSRALGWIASLAADGLVRSTSLLDLMPVVMWRVAPPGWPVVCLYYAALAAGWVVEQPRLARRTAAALLVAAGIWIVLEPWAIVARRGDGRLHVTFLDVGQGDSSLVRLPAGSTLLVDAGGVLSASFDIGDRVVAPVLRAGGIRRLDVLALTHGDPDHVGGAKSVIREFRPKEVWEGVPVPRFEPLRELRAEAFGAGARWSTMNAGASMRLDGVDVFVRHPPPADWERQRVRNDDSLVLEVRWRNMSLVLTGDVGAAVEPAIVKSIPPAPIRVVKVPHHGSLTSSTPAFVHALAPTVAIVSAGRSNHFGHPAAAVLARYQEAGAEIFRTDKDGEVSVDTDGYNIQVRGFTGRTLAIQDHEATKTRKQQETGQSFASTVR
jgi:competence protein ComEC